MRSELHGEVKAFVEQVVGAMGLTVSVEVSGLEDGASASRAGENDCARRKGKASTLQHLVNRHTPRRRPRSKIVIDAMKL